MRETITTTTVDVTTTSVRYDTNAPEHFYPTLPESERREYVAAPSDTSHDAAMINEHGSE